MSVRFALSTALSLVCASCAGTPHPAAGAAAPSATPAAGNFEKEFEEMLKREATLGAPVPVSSPDGRVSVRVPAVTPPTIAKRGQGEDVEYPIEIPIGVEEPIRCIIFPHLIDAGGVMRSLVVGQLATMSEHETNDLDAGVFGKAPYLYSGSIYYVMQNGKRLKGNLKVIVVRMNGQSFACSHDVPGYRKTLEATARMIGESLVVSGIERLDSAFVEMAILAVDGRRVGFDETRIFDMGQGKTSLVDATTLMLASSPSDISAEDSVTYEQADARGLLASGRYVAVANAAKTHDLTLTRGAGGKLAVKGELHGKPFSATISTQGPLYSGAFDPVLVRRGLLAHADKSQISYEHYSPESDPTSGTVTTVSRLKPPKDSYTFVARSGDHEMLEELDDSGLARKFELGIGAVKLVGERVFLDGKLPFAK